MAGTIDNPSGTPGWLRANGPKLAILVASLATILGLVRLSSQLSNLATYVQVAPPTNDAGAVIDGGGVVTVSSTVQLGSGGPTWSEGVAIPTQAAPVGSLYSRLAVDGGAPTVYVRGNDGWHALTWQ